MTKFQHAKGFVTACVAMPFVIAWFFIALLGWKALVLRSKCSMPNIDQSAD